MTDYLGKLVKRSQTAGPFLRPRPITRFETPTPVKAELEPILEDRDMNGLESETPMFNHSVNFPTADSAQENHTEIDDETQALHTIVVPPDTAATVPAEKTSIAPERGDRRPTLFDDRGPNHDNVPLPFESKTSGTVVKVRPSKSRAPQDSVDLTTSRSRREPQLRQPTEPDINVTIGNVEIQAVLPTDKKSVVRRKAAPPPLTLDDYLGKRTS